MGRAPERVIPLVGARRGGAPLTADRVGGKAAGLSRLAEAGLPVPDGFVLPAEVLEQVLRAAGLAELAERAFRNDVAAAELRTRLPSLPIAPAVADGWRAAARALGPSLAVRSSGLDEDGGDHSFAGQHTTLLGVSPDGVVDAVRACWASLWSERALSYRRSRSAGPSSLAVLVQRLVTPRSSGVLFTTNPVTGSWRESVVEAVWGLGEGLVSGQLAPHAWSVRRPRGGLPKGLWRLAARLRLEVTERHVFPLTEQLVAGEDGPVTVPVPAERRDRPTLGDAELLRLARLGLEVERLLGRPADVEWVVDEGGRLWLLQARPITSRPAPRREAGQVLWTRRFVGERWPEPVTPLGWSLLEPVLTWFVGYPETQARLLGGGPALALHHGHPYVNATVFRHLLFKLPGSPPPSFMLELVPPAEERDWLRRSAAGPDLEVYASILRTTFAERRWERFRWNPFTNHLVWDRFEAHLAAELGELGGRGATLEVRLALVERHLGLVRDYVGIHICSLLFAHLSWQLLDGLLASSLPDRRTALRDALAICPPGNLTVETNRAIRALAAVATPEDLARLEQGLPAFPPFADALAAFLERFGHRSESSWELMSPRWRREPARLVPLLRSQRAGSPDPTVHEQRLEERHRGALAELRGSLAGPRLTLAELLVHYTRRYLLLRENQRFWFDRLLWSFQDLLSTFGEDAEQAGWLPDAGDVAYLTWPELEAALRGGPTQGLAGLARVRREQAARDRDTTPPTFLLGRDPEPAPPEPGDLRLRGLGISPGRRRGRVRILRSLGDGDRLRPGDVLVARSVDPAWTPLFLTAGAVVLELGSMLSHGAVVAREYGVPAVVNVEGATHRLVEGQEVTVDGSQGTLVVHRPA